MQTSYDHMTIYAVSTPPGRGGIGVVRISGGDTLPILRALFHRDAFAPRTMVYGKVFDAADRLLDEAMAVYFPAPHSYTGEDVAEIHGHGNPTILSAIMDAIGSVCKNARPADNGEFTKRAFLNGKMDLTEAEAVMEVISARSMSAVDASLRQLGGEVDTAISAIRSDLMDATAGLEAAIDYPEEEWEDEAVTAAVALLKSAQSRIEALGLSYERGRLVKEGIGCTMVGAPNAGKSSLLNAIAGFPRAIVDDTPGTTRDVLEYPFTYMGQLIRLYDTAGRRDVKTGAEAIGLQMGEAAVHESDVIILVLDGAEPLCAEDYAAARLCMGKPTVIAYNKMDLGRSLTRGELYRLGLDAPVVEISAKEGEGVEELLFTILTLSGLADGVEDTLITSARQRDCLMRAKDALGRAIDAHTAGVPFDLVSQDAMDALSALYSLTGEDPRADVIDTIFKKFCVGK